MTTESHPAKVTDPEEKEKVGKLKLALLYVLIGGLVASAIIAIAGILIGEFNSALQKAFGTIFVFVTHSLFILGLVWSDRHNRLGRSLIPTVLLGTALANIVTTTLGTWEIIEGETAWRFVLFYMLLIGSSFMITAIVRLNVADKLVTILTRATVGSLIAWTLLLAPWVFEVVARFNPLYFRIVAAFTILTTTLFLVTVILRSIAVARRPALRAKAKAANSHPISGGFLAYYITIGVIASFVWLGGLIAFISDGVRQDRYYDYHTEQVED